MCNGADIHARILVFDAAPMVRGRRLLETTGYAVLSRRWHAFQAGAIASEPGKVRCG